MSPIPPINPNDSSPFQPKNQKEEDENKSLLEKAGFIISSEEVKKISEKSFIIDPGLYITDIKKIQIKL